MHSDEGSDAAQLCSTPGSRACIDLEQEENRDGENQVVSRDDAHIRCSDEDAAVADVKEEEEEEEQQGQGDDENCWLCDFCTNPLAESITGFIADRISVMDVDLMADQIHEEIVRSFPYASGASVGIVREHIQSHILLPSVKMASMIRSLTSVAETVRRVRSSPQVENTTCTKTLTSIALLGKPAASAYRGTTRRTTRWSWTSPARSSTSRSQRRSWQHTRWTRTRCSSCHPRANRGSRGWRTGRSPRRTESLPSLVCTSVGGVQ